MDARLWHDQARRPAPEPPTPVSRAGLSSYTVEARTAYANTVRTWLRQQPVDSTLHTRAAAGLTSALESARMEPAGARTILALSAPFTAGKSTLVKTWAQALHRTWLGDKVSDPAPRWDVEPGIVADLVPVVYLSLLSESRSKDLYAQILSFIGYPTIATETRLALQATRAFGLHQVRLLIIDDAHMLRTSSVTGRATLNAVKHLNTVLGEEGGVLVLVGAHLSGGEALSDPQIRGRLAEHTLTPYAVDTPAGRRDWQHLLRHLEERLAPYLPEQDPGYLTSRHAAYLWACTQGFIGDLASLVIDATTCAIADGVPLDRDHFARVVLSARAQEAYAHLTAAPEDAPGRARRGRDRDLNAATN